MGYCTEIFRKQPLQIPASQLKTACFCFAHVNLVLVQYLEFRTGRSIRVRARLRELKRCNIFSYELGFGKPRSTARKKGDHWEAKNERLIYIPSCHTLLDYGYTR